jgi:hypothetical protein
MGGEVSTSKRRPIGVGSDTCLIQHFLAIVQPLFTVIVFSHKRLHTWTGILSRVWPPHLLAGKVAGSYTLVLETKKWSPLPPRRIGVKCSQTIKRKWY